MANIVILIINPSISDAEKYETIKNADARTLTSISESDLKQLVEMASEDGQMRWGQQKECSNHWNAWVEGFESYNGKFFVNIYCQGDSTDENYMEYYSRFNRCGYRGTSDTHNFNVQFNNGEIASCIRFLLKECVRRMFTDKEKIERAKLVNQLKSYKVINPVVDAYYDEYNLRHSLNKYSDRYDVAKHKAYYHAKGKLDEYITDNADELLGKSERELIAIYKEKFYEYAREFRNNFTDADFREWRSKQWFF